MVAGKYLTYEEAGVALGLSAGYVKHLVSGGKLHSVKAKEVGHKGVTKYISDKELEVYKQRKLTRSVVSASSEQQHMPAMGNAKLDWFSANIIPLAHQAIAKNKEIVQVVTDNARALLIEEIREPLLSQTYQRLIDVGIPQEVAKAAVDQGGNAAVDAARDNADSNEALENLIQSMGMGVAETKAVTELAMKTQDVFETAQLERDRAIPAEIL